MPYKVPFVNIPLQYKNLKEEILGVFDDVLSRGDLILRRDVEEFEKSIADYVGVKHAIGLNSGTDALFLPLKILGIGQGDEVITVSHTFVASISVIYQCGAKPVLVDVKKDFTIDEEELEEAITEKTKAIIPVHLNGRVCQMDRIMEIAEKNNLYVIEDAAQALGAKLDGKMAGSFGAAAGFSMYPFKVLGSFGDAGVMTTNDDKIAEKIRLLRDHGQKTKTEIACYGWNFRLDNIQAAILNLKFKYFPSWIKRRREIASVYNSFLGKVEGVEVPPAPDSDSRHFDNFQNYVLKVQKRNQLKEFLEEKGVETLVKDPIANHFQQGLGLSHFKLPYSEKLAEEVISLPMYPELTGEQVEYAAKCVEEFYSK